MEELRVLRRGEGPPMLLIHGGGADRTTWTIQLARPPDGLAGSFTLIAYDRRGAASAPLPPGLVPTTELHAADAAAVLEREVAQRRALVCGASYGAVVALELAQRAPERVAGLVLCEPPLPAGLLVPAAPFGFGCAFEALAATAGGPRAAEMFFRTVLGDAEFDRLPGRIRRTLLGLSAAIRADMVALERYRHDPERVAAGVRCPALLLTGERSPPMYADPIASLARILPSSRTRVLAGAGHAMHIDAYRAFAREVLAFAGDVGLLAEPAG
jgi:pimeloyl-ACP methyl ester carboxylesterase